MTEAVASQSKELLAAQKHDFIAEKPIQAVHTDSASLQVAVSIPRLGTANAKAAKRPRDDPIQPTTGPVAQPDQPFAHDGDDEEEEEASDIFEEDLEACLFKESHQEMQHGIADCELELKTPHLEYEYPLYLTKLPEYLTDQNVFGKDIDAFLSCHNLVDNSSHLTSLDSHLPDFKATKLQQTTRNKPAELLCHLDAGDTSNDESPLAALESLAVSEETKRALAKSFAEPNCTELPAFVDTSRSSSSKRRRTGGSTSVGSIPGAGAAHGPGIGSSGPSGAATVVGEHRVPKASRYVRKKPRNKSSAAEFKTPGDESATTTPLRTLDESEAEAPTTPTKLAVSANSSPVAKAMIKKEVEEPEPPIARKGTRHEGQRTKSRAQKAKDKAKSGPRKSLTKANAPVATKQKRTKQQQIQKTQVEVEAEADDELMNSTAEENNASTASSSSSDSSSSDTSTSSDSSSSSSSSSSSGSVSSSEDEQK